MRLVGAVQALRKAPSAPFFRAVGMEMRVMILNFSVRAFYGVIARLDPKSGLPDFGTY